MQELLSLANALADEAGAIVRRYFRQNLVVESKTDETPVTIADREVEARLREIIGRMRPEDGIMGEEYGPQKGRSGYIWVLDPIDGTKSFIAGRPTFGTLIALCRDGVPVLGVIDQPILRERWSGDGQTTTFNGKPVTTQKCPSLKDAKAVSTDPYYIQKLWPIVHKECKMMIWGGDCYSYGLLANGGVDAVVEQGLAPYDFAALVPVVTGAGGWMGDWEGNPLTLHSDGRTLALGNPALKDSFLSLLKA